MITRMCRGRCGRRVALNAVNGRCAVCNASYRPGGSWSEGRDRIAQRRFREEVLRRAGGRCEWFAGGRRCPRTSELEAHHTEPGNDDPVTGRALCREHHRAVDPHAR